MSSSVQPGATFAGYAIERLIGRGGAGSVYLAQHPRLPRKIALKVLSDMFGGDADSRVRFEREADTAARLEHPNIVSILDRGHTDGLSWIAMQFIDGTDALAALRDGPIAAPRAVRITREIAKALDHAHERGILHRDIKPSNILLERPTSDEPERVFLADFGIAKLSEGPRELTQEGEIVGSLSYAAPEQLEGTELDRRVDVYALGCALFHMLTGVVPYNYRTPGALIRAHLLGGVPRLGEHPFGGQGLQAFDAVIARALAKNRDDRFPTCGELAAAAEAALDQALPELPTMAGITLERSIPTASPPIDDSPTFVPGQSQWPTVQPLGTSTSADLAGQVIGGRYHLLEHMARGLSGDLYKAYDDILGELVAVKLVQAVDADTKKRLQRGGRVWLKLTPHPNVVEVMDVQNRLGSDPPYIVSKIVDGIDLAELAKNRDLRLDESVWIVIQVCAALKHIHESGIVHREIKPSNILVAGKNLLVTVLDSGIARHENPAVDSFTKTGIFVGDLAYAAPEQMQEGRQVGRRADIYAVVAVLYELVTGTRLPFPVPTGWEPDQRLLTELPDRLRSALTRGLCQDPKGRFTSVDELHDCLAPLSKRAPQLLVRGPAVVALHGIRTHAAWQRSLTEVAGRAGIGTHVDLWNFGYFSILRFLMPWARLAKVRWFREIYQREFGNTATAAHEMPSIVAHSFGTYILGNALIRYPYLRFRKVLLCGSILPTNFPWDLLIERGQVQAVRNEYGSEDVWTRAVSWFVSGTGPSGLAGFTANNARLQQEKFTFAHSEYFERGHMISRWLPFLTAHVEERPMQETAAPPPPAGNRPWGLYIAYAVLVGCCALVIAAFAV
ncbi:serine/threonine-protein kinase [Nocardia altamirensis]|uniref:serine/threonine-protein kinase n=1 Tax=Nocardia altamirensis TaxID=472158 RepID=UPI000A4ED660|nr:serine/threonine-protein kinase [Nocardia altamirensis]